jgi:pimeloyl-ACP methyl ester carboxylesterase
MTSRKTSRPSTAKRTQGLAHASNMRVVGRTRLCWLSQGPQSKPREDVPVAVSVFPDDLYQVPRSWAEQAYPNLIHYNKLDKGGHFAAWEQPQLFSEEVRAGLRSLR